MVHQGFASSTLLVAVCNFFFYQISVSDHRLQYCYVGFCLTLSFIITLIRLLMIIWFDDLAFVILARHKITRTKITKRACFCNVDFSCQVSRCLDLQPSVEQPKHVADVRKVCSLWFGSGLWSVLLLCIKGYLCECCWVDFYLKCF